MNLPLALGMPGPAEWMFIMVIVVLLFGAKKLPELAKGLGQSLGEFKKAREEFEREIHKSAEVVETKQPEVTVKPVEDKQPLQPQPTQPPQQHS